MKAITCSQCGGLISKVSELQTIAQCDYCGAKILITPENAPSQNDKSQKAEDKPKLINEFGYPIDQYIPFDEKQISDNFTGLKVITIMVVIGIGFAIFLMVISNSKSIPQKTLLKLTATPTPKKDYEVLLEFGGKGTSAGLFNNPSEIAVDTDGNIYVSDETLRVQRFDANGKFVSLWNVKGNKNEKIDKLAADADGNVYVLIGGEIVVYNRQTGEQKQVLSDSRKHYIDDFVLRDDGGMMYVAENTQNEEFVHIKGRATVNRLVGIHTKAAETTIPTQAIRIAVDGKGDIYSVYALGDVYGGFSYNEEDLMIFHFTPQGKFVNKFAAGLVSSAFIPIGLVPSAILIDNQSRIYLLNSNRIYDVRIVVFSNTGNEIKRINFVKFESIKTMTLDRQNNLYVISGEKIRKWKAIDFGT
ncbi:MAG: hypothetical protein ABI686_07520 [Acidobacteriota bacterium]